MSNTIWAVDGSFFAQRLSGIQRYSIELLAALDRIVPPGFVEIVTPPGVETPHYTNIKVVSFGTHRGGVWQQLDYPRYLRQRGAGGLADNTTKFDGGEIVRNAEENRLQILFDEIPDADTRDALKSNGFRWSPRNKAWQRQLTQNAEYAARRVLGL